MDRLATLEQSPSVETRQHDNGVLHFHDNELVSMFPLRRVAGRRNGNIVPSAGNEFDLVLLAIEWSKSENRQQLVSVLFASNEERRPFSFTKERKYDRERIPAEFVQRQHHHLSRSCNDIQQQQANSVVRLSAVP
jgi:hypothetical protein